jgi:hypothetical protein
MRTTIDLDDELLAEAKQVAARTGQSLAALVEDALRECLHRRRQTARRTVELPTFGEGGVQPGVDLEDRAGLLNLMEQDDDESTGGAAR